MQSGGSGLHISIRPSNFKTILFKVVVGLVFSGLVTAAGICYEPLLGLFGFVRAADAVVVPGYLSPPLPTPLRAGNLVVTVNVPAAVVVVNGMDVGDATQDKPLHVTDIPVGEAYVQIHALGYHTAEAMVAITDGKWARRSFELKPLVAEVSLPPAPSISRPDPGKLGAVGHRENKPVVESTTTSELAPTPEESKVARVTRWSDAKAYVPSAHEAQPTPLSEADPSVARIATRDPGFSASPDNTSASSYSNATPWDGTYPSANTQAQSGTLGSAPGSSNPAGSGTRPPRTTGTTPPSPTRTPSTPSPSGTPRTPATPPAPTTPSGTDRSKPLPGTSGGQKGDDVPVVGNSATTPTRDPAKPPFESRRTGATTPSSNDDKDRSDRGANSTRRKDGRSVRETQPVVEADTAAKTVQSPTRGDDSGGGRSSGQRGRGTRSVARGEGDPVVGRSNANAIVQERIPDDSRQVEQQPNGTSGSPATPRRTPVPPDSALSPRQVTIKGRGASPSYGQREQPSVRAPQPSPRSSRGGGGEVNRERSATRSYPSNVVEPRSRAVAPPYQGLPSAPRTAPMPKIERAQPRGPGAVYEQRPPRFEAPRPAPAPRGRALAPSGRTGGGNRGGVRGYGR